MKLKIKGWFNNGLDKIKERVNELKDKVKEIRKIVLLRDKDMGKVEKYG